MARPLKYTEDKFKNVTETYLTRDGVPTKSGLLLALDLSRQAWDEYKDRIEFGDTIKRAELTIEEAWVQRLAGNNVAGTIFYLKNAFKEHYRDNHDFTTDGKAIQVQLSEVVAMKNGLGHALPSRSE